MPGATSGPGLLRDETEGFSLGFAAVPGRARIESSSTPAGSAFPVQSTSGKVAVSAPAAISTAGFAQVCALTMRAVRGACLEGGGSACATDAPSRVERATKRDVDRDIVRASERAHRDHERGAGTK